MYKYAPLVLLSGGFVLWSGAFLVERHYSHHQSLVWVPFIIIQMITSAVCGVLIKKLYWMAHVDMLTGLCNRRYFYERISELKDSTPVSLVLIDVDNFKSINDTYGHNVGDRVLQQFAEILRSNTRNSDIVARWGGEEFAVILPQTDVEKAYKIADRIRMIVEDHVFSYGTVTCKFTVSMGIASTKDAAGVDVEQLIKMADEALYRAKERKNYVICQLIS